jgi:hypothetical protein
MEINALTIGEKWLAFRGAEEHICTVHSVFDRVINISTGQGLLSVAAEGIGGSSSFVTIPGRAIGLSVRAGERCVVRDGRMYLAECTVNFRNSALWKGPISRNYRHNSVKSENIAAFKAVVDRKAPARSAWRQIHGDSGVPGFKVIQKLKNDPLQARSLIGLGQGLTPAGDDMLLGFLAIVNHTSTNRSFLRELRDAVSSVLEKTVDISAQALANALDWDYHEYVQNCILAVCEGEKEEVYIATASLVGIGATSGSDIACGMYFGMME